MSNLSPGKPQSRKKLLLTLLLLLLYAALALCWIVGIQYERSRRPREAAVPLTPEELSGTEHFEAVATRDARMALDASNLAQTVYDGVEETEFALEDWNGCTLAVEGADDTTLMAESEEELKSLLMKVKEESGKVGLKRNIQKTKIMASGP